MRHSSNGRRTTELCSRADLEPQHARDTRRDQRFARPGLRRAAQDIERRVQDTARQKREARHGQIGVPRGQGFGEQLEQRANHEPYPAVHDHRARATPAHERRGAGDDRGEADLGQPGPRRAPEQSIERKEQGLEQIVERDVEVRKRRRAVVVPAQPAEDEPAPGDE